MCKARTTFLFTSGTLNGTTNLDRTNYFEVLPSNQLEVALWLESDRMGFLLDSVTQRKFEVQRATVKNERGQNYDNRPYGLAGEKTSAALYQRIKNFFKSFTSTLFKSSM